MWREFAPYNPLFWALPEIALISLKIPQREKNLFPFFSLRKSSLAVNVVSHWFGVPAVLCHAVKMAFCCKLSWCTQTPGELWCQAGSLSQYARFDTMSTLKRSTIFQASWLVSTASPLSFCFLWSQLTLLPWHPQHWHSPGEGVGLDLHLFPIGILMEPDTFSSTRVQDSLRVSSTSQKGLKIICETP